MKFQMGVTNIIYLFDYSAYFFFLKKKRSLEKRNLIDFFLVKIYGSLWLTRLYTQKIVLYSGVCKSNIYTLKGIQMHNPGLLSFLYLKLTCIN
jgi:hypothetical protein